MDNNKNCVTCNIAYTKGIPFRRGCGICKTEQLENWRRAKRLYIKPFFRWYDLWVGLYIDKANKTIYVCPLPMIGLKIKLNIYKHH